ncbi:MAG: rRNA maturation RNase YbeY [Oscillospiraceae bacterium]|nr:rRNA maturation RNase YbeY [Oscillospiraceae bacterium]
MIKLKAYFVNRQKEEEVSAELRAFLRKCIRATLIADGYDDFFEVYVTLVNDKQIHEMNLEHRGVDAPTDVLSFPMGEDGVYDIDPETGAYMLGDVVLNVSRIRLQAEEYGHSFEREAGYLTIHSILHLLGYDHVDEGEMKKQMRAKEEQVLESLHLYRD